MLGVGTLGDRIGRKRVMLAGRGGVYRGIGLRAMAPNTATLIGARAIMGIGAAACEPGTLSLLRHLYPSAPPGARALGLWAAIAGLALAMGPVLGGLLVGAGGWRAIFWFNLGAGVAGLGGRAAPPSRRAPIHRPPAPTSPASCSPRRPWGRSSSPSSSARRRAMGQRRSSPCSPSPRPRVWPSWRSSAAAVRRCSMSPTCASPPSRARWRSPSPPTSGSSPSSS